MAKDRYTEERNKQEVAKRAEIKELQEKAVEEALKMTEPPVLTKADIKEIDEIRNKQKNVPASDFDFIKTKQDDGSNDSVVSAGIGFDTSGLGGSG